MKNMRKLPVRKHPLCHDQRILYPLPRHAQVGENYLERIQFGIIVNYSVSSSGISFNVL